MVRPAFSGKLDENPDKIPTHFFFYLLFGVAQFKWQRLNNMPLSKAAVLQFSLSEVTLLETPPLYDPNTSRDLTTDTIQGKKKKKNRLTLQIHPSFRADLTLLVGVNAGCCAVSGGNKKQLGELRHGLLEGLTLDLPG